MTAEGKKGPMKKPTMLMVVMEIGIEGTSQRRMCETRAKMV